jgi:hypothetical protein
MMNLAILSTIALALLLIITTLPGSAERTLFVPGVVKEGQLVVMVRVGNPASDMHVCVDFSASTTLLRRDTASWSKSRDATSELYGFANGGPYLQLPTDVDSNMWPRFCDARLGLGIHSDVWMHWSAAVITVDGIKLVSSSSPSPTLATTGCTVVSLVNALGEPHALTVDALVNGGSRKITFFSNTTAGLGFGFDLYDAFVRGDELLVEVGGERLDVRARNGLRAGGGASLLYAPVFDVDSIVVGSNVLRYCRVSADFSLDELKLCCRERAHAEDPMLAAFVAALNISIVVLWWIDGFDPFRRVLLTFMVPIITAVVAWIIDTGHGWRYISASIVCVLGPILIMAGISQKRAAQMRTRVLAEATLVVAAWLILMTVGGFEGSMLDMLLMCMMLELRMVFLCTIAFGIRNTEWTRPLAFLLALYSIVMCAAASLRTFGMYFIGSPLSAMAIALLVVVAVADIGIFLGLRVRKKWPQLQTHEENQLVDTGVEMFFDSEQWERIENMKKFFNGENDTQRKSERYKLI